MMVMMGMTAADPVLKDNGSESTHVSPRVMDPSQHKSLFILAAGCVALAPRFCEIIPLQPADPSRCFKHPISPF